MRFRFSILAMLVCALVATGANATVVARDSLTFKSYNGRSIQAEQWRVRVPSRHRASGPTIEVAFVRLPATTRQPAAPIVFLDGGPGSSGIRTGAIRGFFETFDALRGIADVILLDQRGIGASHPVVRCPPPDRPRLDLFGLDRPAQLERARSDAQSCLAHLRAEGIDPAAFNTVESAHDLEDVRIALGVPKLSLLGLSYGTHLALATIRLHGGRLERVALIGVEGPDDTIKLPSALDGSFARVAALASVDSSVNREVPDMVASLRRILARIDGAPIHVTLADPKTGESATLPVNGDGLRRILLQDLGDTADFVVFPALLATLERGDPGLLTWFVRKRFLQSSRGGFPALATSVNGASGATVARWRRIERESAGALFVPREFVFRSLLGEWPATDLGDTFRGPLSSDVRTLAISGSLDANTPPAQAEAALRGFPRATSLVVENAGHDDLLGSRDVEEVLIAFFGGLDVSKRKLVRPIPRFLTIDAAQAERGVRP